jgi:hypothetical protein
MRFSLKWVLFGMAYVALTAAALTQDQWAYADLLWLTTFLAICWAIVTAIFSNGSRRAAAIGFAIFAVGFAACAQVAETSIPTRRFLLAAGVPEYPFIQPSPYQPSPVLYATPQLAPPTTFSPSNSNPIAVQPVPAYAPPSTVSVVTFASSPIELPFISKVRAANSFSSMFLGLIGAWLAAAAYRRHRLSNDTTAR